MRRLPWLCLAVLSASCRNSDEPRRDNLQVRSNAQQVPQVPHWNLVEEWRVGGAVSGPHSLSNVLAIRILRDGRIVVLENADQQVHVLSPRGIPLKTMGRRGKGPGEFNGAINLVLAPDDQIIVYDWNTERLTFFSPDGNLLKTEPHARGGRVAWVRSDGRLEELGTQVLAGPNGGRDTVDFRRTWSSDYQKADTVRSPPCPLLKRIPREFTSWASPHPDGGRIIHDYPFLPAVDRLDTPDGTWVGPFPDFRVIHRVAAGTCAPAVTITLQGAPIPVPAAVRDEIQDALRGRSHSGDMLPPDPTRIRAALPFFEALFTDTQDRLWVKRLVDSTVRFSRSVVFGMPTVAAKGTPRFEVYSPQGALVALVSVPSYIRTVSPSRFAITAERVYTVVWDEDGVPYLCSFRIVAPGSDTTVTPQP